MMTIEQNLKDIIGGYVLKIAELLTANQALNAENAELKKKLESK